MGLNKRSILANKKYNSSAWEERRKVSCRTDELRRGSDRTGLLVGATLVILALVLVFLLASTIFNQSARRVLTLLDPEVEQPPSHSPLYRYSRAGLSSDSIPCSKIGRDILKKNGTAVDAALAISLCSGIVNMEAMGVGGGFIMTVYVRAKRRAYSIVARETAPRDVRWEMFSKDGQQSRTGGLAVGVPGELKGYWQVWKRFGRLPWKEIVMPSVELCYRGYEMSKPQRDALNFRPEVPKDDPNLRKWFVNEETGDFKKWGATIIPTKLCQTYKRIAEEGGTALYTGSLAQVLVEDVRVRGGLLSAEDLKRYKEDWTQPFSMRLGEDVLYTSPPPGSGALLCLILQILKGYEFTRDDFSTADRTAVSLHRIVEAFKFTFAQRGLMGDPNFVNVSLTEEFTDESYSEDIRNQIIKGATFSNPKYYGAVEFGPSDFGTNHVSVLSPEGDAVSSTSSINLYFGAGFTSERTGIILNSVMDDFSFPNLTNYFGLPPLSRNFIRPGKRPLSSACPTIIVDKEGDVKLVVGASGGTRIITALSWVIMRMLWLGDDLKSAVDSSRIHHQLTPMKLSYEFGLLKQVVAKLRNVGHVAERSTTRGSVVCGVARTDGGIYVNADYRKFGIIGHVEAVKGGEDSYE